MNRRLKSSIYHRLPDSIQAAARRWYYTVTEQERQQRHRSNFIEEIFDSELEYQRYADEFRKGPAVQIRDESLKQFKQITGDFELGGVPTEVARDYYALCRKMQPKIVVETGVCNGVSTLAILLALHENDAGELYSIDYPFRADESLAEFQEETFEQ